MFYTSKINKKEKENYYEKEASVITDIRHGIGSDRLQLRRESACAN